MTDLTVLGFGTSARRGQTAWMNPAPWAALMRAAAPAHVAHGASPSGGADAVIDDVSRTYYREHGLDPHEHVHPFPVDTSVDGPWPRAGMARNGRMLARLLLREEPDLAPAPALLAVGLVVGRVGQAVGTRGCVFSNGSDNMARRVRAARVPLVVYREDGVEPCPGARTLEGPLVGGLLGACLALGALFERGLFADDVSRAGRVVKEAMLLAKTRNRTDGQMDQALMSALSAIEALMVGQPRIAPWVAPVDVRLRMLTSLSWRS